VFQLLASLRPRPVYCANTKLFPEKEKESKEFVNTITIKELFGEDRLIIICVFKYAVHDLVVRFPFGITAFSTISL
jgi:hypothetical protein